MNLFKTKKSRKEFVKWIKALRSDKFLQGRHQLQSRDGYCCLGVACEVLPFEKQRRNGGSLVAGLPEQQKTRPNGLRK